MDELELRDLAVDEVSTAGGVDREQRRVHERTAALGVDDQVVGNPVGERHRAGVIDHLLAVVKRKPQLQRSRRELDERRRAVVRDAADVGRRRVERCAGRRYIDVESRAAERGVDHADLKQPTRGVGDRVGEQLRCRRGCRAVDEIGVLRVTAYVDRRVNDRRRPTGDADLEFLTTRVGTQVRRLSFERKSRHD